MPAPARCVDAAELIWRLRTIKSDAEVAYIAESNRINGDALRACVRGIRPGDDEVDVARIVGRSIVDAGAVRPPYAQINVLSEAKSRARGGGFACAGRMKEYALADGDLLFVDSGAVTAGYWGEFVRMASRRRAVGGEAGHHDAIRSIVQRSTEESMRRRRRVPRHRRRSSSPSIASMATARTIRGVRPLRRRCTTATASASPAAEPPFIRPRRATPTLEPGMVITVEAYLSVEGMTYASEEDVLITPDGPRILSPLDEGLFLL